MPPTNISRTRANVWRVLWQKNRTQKDRSENFLCVRSFCLICKFDWFFLVQAILCYIYGRCIRKSTRQLRWCVTLTRALAAWGIVSSPMQGTKDNKSHDLAKLDSTNMVNLLSGWAVGDIRGSDRGFSLFFREPISVRRFFFLVAMESSVANSAR